MTPDPALAPFDKLLGNWTTEATHPLMPGVVVHGTAVIEWLDGERFLLIRSHTDHPKFPHALSVIGDMDHDRDDGGDGKASMKHAGPLQMHYFDSRGVFRSQLTKMTDDAWEWWRDDPAFAQRFTGRITDGGDTIVGLSQLKKNGGEWADDLAITYRRQKS